MNRVLVVDDSPTILKVVSAILARSGFEPETARDGAMGLQKLAARGPFDLVLLDFVMPKMNGYQFCRELRSNPAYKAVPIILMSAKSDRIRDQFVQQTGAVDAISKPFDARALVAVVEGALSKLRSGRIPVIPEGETMPEEASLSDEESRPSALPRRLARRALDDLALHLSQTIGPALAAASPSDLANPEVVEKVIGKVISAAPFEKVLGSIREAAVASNKEVLSGDLALVSIAEILQLLDVQKQTGMMRVVSGTRSMAISIDEGQVDHVRATADKNEFRLGRYFVEMGVLTRAQIEDAVVLATKAGRTLGEELVATNKITDEVRQKALEKQSCELVYDLVRWPYGRFSFVREPHPAEAQAANLGLRVAGLVLEGFRRVDEWRLMEGTIIWDQVVVVDDGARERVGASLTRAEQMILGAFDGQRTITHVLAATELARFDAVKIVYQFLSSRVLRTKS